MEEPLKLVCEERWPELQETFKADWPRSMLGYYSVQAQRHMRARSLGTPATIYCPYGDFSNGMIAFLQPTQRSTLYIIIQCPKDDTSQLEEALVSTKLIKWNKYFEVPFAPPHIVQAMERVSERLDIKIRVDPNWGLKMSREFEDVSIPEGITLGPVTLEHVDLVNSTWPHKYDGSEEYFQLLIKADCGYGLFKDNQLICWVFYNEKGALTHLFTLVEHRKMGYGKLLIKLATNIWIKEGKEVVLTCRKKNPGAYEFYKKLGFDYFSDLTYVMPKGVIQL